MRDNYRPPIDHSRVQPPLSKRTAWRSTPLPPPLILKPDYEWKKWEEFSVRVRGIMPHETTYNLWKNFRTQGNVVYIEIFEGRDGTRQGTAKIKFSPPPNDAFWEKCKPYGLYEINGEDTATRYNVHVAIDERQRGGLKIQSPLKKGKLYPPTMRLSASALHFGIMINPTSMMPLHGVQSLHRNDTTLVVDLLKNRIIANFNVTFQNSDLQGSAAPNFNRINKYMFQIPFSQLKTIQRMDINDQAYALVISLDSPPQYYRKRQDEKAGHTGENLQWTEFDSWYRQTDVVYDPYRLQTATVALHKEQPVIDIGRWTTYLFEFANAKNSVLVYTQLKDALQDFNIEIVAVKSIDKVPAHPADLWSLINPSTSLQPSRDLHYLQGSEATISLPFEVRYQLEVCISREIINEYNITKAFVKTLADIASEDQAKARNILEYVAGQDKRIFDPMSIFDDKEALAFTAKTEIPHYCAYSRKATITPTTIYFNSPTVETTNRVLRHYARENQDGRFLRVQFTDELAEGRINSCAEKQRNDELFTRVYRTLFNGIRIGDRHYEFLAFGNSQFRENGAYFFCPTDHLSCHDIRQWMGNFSHIPIVAKYAARLGQCFSTTRAINGLSKPDIVKIADVQRDEHCFTDGVGKISPFLAQMIAAELGIRSIAPPSAFQFRLGGCKGILVVWPDAKDKEVHIRRSQQKFTAIYNGLEIIRCARFSCATLNRQTITILSSLGVPDEVFLNMLTEQLANYQTAMSNDGLAVSLLLRYIDDNQMTINIATMIRNGFMAERDPFVLSLLHLWRSWSIKLLKEKAKIIVENGAFVLGCVDETGTLRGYTKPTVARGEQFNEDELPQIFIQVPDKVDPNRYNVVEGICLVGRNPSLHPGDLRVVQAVNVPALHHLRDVVVFPLNGERDIPSMCSGGDLDGDDFFVIWDKDLRPPEWNCDPMDYSAPKPKIHNRPVEITDLMKFFVRFMKNDSLPTIAHAHLAQSDYLTDSVKDRKCLELAALHSKAVDYVKTGEPAQMPKRLRPGKWPHFMEKKFKPKDAQYHSGKILGQLYDKVETVNFVPQYEEPFDKRILRAYTLSDALMKTVRQIKTKYDVAMRRVMAQQEIKTEFEIWSTFVLSRPRVGSDYKVQEEIARLSDSLKDQFRVECIAKAGSKDFAVLGPFVAAMYKVTKEELDIALAECRATRLVGGRQVPVRKMEPKYMPLITFPWLFEKELGRIATGIDTSDDLDDLGLAPSALNEHGHSRKRQGRGRNTDTEDYIQQEDGVIVHRGEELDLFRHDVDSDDFADESDFDEARAVRDEHLLTMGDSGEAVLATEFQLTKTPISDHLRSGTGVEDVVPRTELDGFVDPRDSAIHTHDSSSMDSSYFKKWHQESQPPRIHPSSNVIHQNLLTDDSDNAVETPQDSPVAGQSEGRLSDSMVDMALLEPESGEVVAAKEGFVVADLKEPPLEELAHLVGDKSTDSTPDSDGEEEVITLDVKESSLEKLSRLVGS